MRCFLSNIQQYPPVPPSRTHSLPFALLPPLYVCVPVCVAAAACLLVCLFLEAHNMADMCFVIVSTTSYLSAYKGRYPAPIPPKTAKQVALKKH